MKLRVALALSTTLLLAGCTMPSWHDLLNFSDSSGDAAYPKAAPRPVASAAAPAPGAQAAPDPFCASVAQQDAQRYDFDTATQLRMAQRAYQQCVAMFRTQ